MLRRDLSKRYGNLKNGVADIKGHRFFEKIDWAKLLTKKIEAPYLHKIDTSQLHLEKESNFAKNKFKEAEKVPENNDPFASW